MIVYTKGRTPDSAQEYIAPGKHREFRHADGGRRESRQRLGIRDRRRRDSGSRPRPRRRRNELGQGSRAERLHAAVRRRPRADHLEVLHARRVATSSATTPPSTTTTSPTKARTVRKCRSSSASSSRPSPAASSTAAAASRRTSSSSIRSSPAPRSSSKCAARSSTMRVDYAAKHPDADRGRRHHAGDHRGVRFITPRTRHRAGGRHPRRDAEADDRNFIERALKAEIIAAKFGFDASYPYRLQGDNRSRRPRSLPGSAEAGRAGGRDRAHGGEVSSAMPARAPRRRIPTRKSNQNRTHPVQRAERDGNCSPFAAFASPCAR